MPYVFNISHQTEQPTYRMKLGFETTGVPLILGIQNICLSYLGGIQITKLAFRMPLIFEASNLPYAVGIRLSMDGGILFIGQALYAVSAPGNIRSSCRTPYNKRYLFSLVYLVE